MAVLLKVDHPAKCPERSDVERTSVSSWDSGRRTRKVSLCFAFTTREIGRTASVVS